MKIYEFHRPDVGTICIHEPSWWQPWYRKNDPAMHYTPDGEHYWCVPWSRYKEMLEAAKLGRDEMVKFAEMYGHRWEDHE